MTKANHREAGVRERPKRGRGGIAAVAGAIGKALSIFGRIRFGSKDRKRPDPTIKARKAARLR